jgi:integrase/recombinase XerD
MVLALTRLERDRTTAPALATTSWLLSTRCSATPPCAEHCGSIQRVLAIPTKRHDRAEVAYLVPEELDALPAAPDRGTWAGRRDHALLVLVAQAGLRVSELTSLACQDVSLSTGAHVRVMVKGRKSVSTLRLPRTRSGGRLRPIRGSCLKEQEGCQ